MAPRSQSANYLRAHSHTGYVPQSARPASAVQPADHKLTVPKAATARDVHISSLPLSDLNVWLVILNLCDVLYVSHKQDWKLNCHLATTQLCMSLRVISHELANTCISVCGSYQLCIAYLQHVIHIRLLKR